MTKGEAMEVHNGRSRGEGVAVAGLLVVVVLLFSCGENESGNEGDASTNTKCAKGLKAMGPACVPIFDECQDDEVPILGGGCKRVGVKECLGGWGIAGPPDWKCKPIGPPQKCLKGWAKAKGGWCEPILPKGPCAAGTMEVIGKSTCQPIGDCGTGTWGKIKTKSSTIFVDQSYTGGGSDGSRSKPFMTIGAALTQATAGDHIAVAAGAYNENISIERQVTLEGRCAKSVTIKSKKPYQAVEFSKWSTGAVLRGVTITGNGVGVSVDSVSATLESVIVQGCDGRGIGLDSGATLTIRDSLVAGNRDVGFTMFGSKATLEGTVIRDTRVHSTKKTGGVGIVAGTGYEQGKPSVLTLRHSLVSGNREAGILLYSAKVTMEGSVVRYTRERASDRMYGWGIAADLATNLTTPSELTMRDSLVAGNHGVGINLSSSKALLERVVVRNTLSRVADSGAGDGIVAQDNTNRNLPSELTMRESMVVENRETGIILVGSKARLERTVVRDTFERASDGEFGTGIQAIVLPGQKNPSELTLVMSAIRRNRGAGVLLFSSKATRDRTVVSDTRALASDGRGGAGIVAEFQSGQSRTSDVRVVDSLVERNRKAGIILYSSTAKLVQTVVRDTIPRILDNEDGFGVWATVPFDRKEPSTVSISDSVIVGNREVGILLESSNAAIVRSVVRDTGVQRSDKRGGNGIAAKSRKNLNRRSELTISDSVIMGNRNCSIMLEGARGTLKRSSIMNTLKDGHDQFGDGIAAIKKSNLVLVETDIQSHARAGLLFGDSGGSVHHSIIRKNVFAIDLEDGSSPTIGTDNQIIDNQINKVTTGQGLKAAPMPSVPDPLGSDAGAEAVKDAGPPP